MENMNIYEKVRKVPATAIKAIGGGRLKGMSDINPMWRIKTLTETFGPCGFGWTIKVTNKGLEKGSGDEVVCFVDIELKVKVDGEWSEPIFGTGGSSFVTLDRSGLYTSDECYKMAYTDAISVACKSLGVAADVYFANDRTKYTQPEDASPSNRPERNNAPANGAAAAPAVPQGPKLITDGQYRKLQAKAIEAGFKKKDKDDLIEAIRMLTGRQEIAEMNGIRMNEFDSVLGFFDNQITQSAAN